MKLELIDENGPDTPPVFLKRCLELGFAEWCLDLNGMAVNDPVCPPPLKMWLSSHDIRDLMVHCAELWASEDTPSVLEPVKGMRLYPFIIGHRGRRTGFSVLIAFTDEILAQSILNEWTHGDPLALSALQHAVKGLVHPWDSMSVELEMLLNWMHDDLDSMRESDLMVEGYTEQLSESYETVTALHMLGQEMGSVDDPCAYIEQTLDMIGVTIGYQWAAFVMDTAEEVALFPEKLYQFGEHMYGEAELRAELKILFEDQPLAVTDNSAIYPAQGLFDRFSPQLIVHPVKAHGTRYGWLIAAGKQGTDAYVSSHDTKTFDSITGIFAAFLENNRLFQEQQKTFLGTVRALSGAIDAKDRYTQGHSERVALLAKQLSEAVGYSPDAAERVRLAGILHDVGKIGVPEAVLCKDGRLTREEFDQIKQHPRIGAEILDGLPNLQDILPGVLYHHERWDGNGYPEGICEKEIPEIARILALADTFDAMSSNRAYRSARTREEVLKEINRCSGTQFDPDLAMTFLKLDFSAFDEAVKDHAAQDPYRDAA